MATKKKKVLSTQKASLFKFIKPSKKNILAKKAEKLPVTSTPKKSKLLTKGKSKRKGTLQTGKKPNIVSRGVQKVKQFFGFQPGVAQRGSDVLVRAGISPDPNATQEESLRDAALGLSGGAILKTGGKAVLKGAGKIISRFGTKAETKAGEATLKRGRDIIATTTEKAGAEQAQARIVKETVKLAEKTLVKGETYIASKGLNNPSVIKTASGKGKLVQTTLSGKPAFVVNTKVASKVSSAISKLRTSISAKGIIVGTLSLGGTGASAAGFKAWGGWAEGEGLDAYSFAQTKAINNKMWDLADSIGDEMKEAQDAMLENSILDWTPFGVIEGNKVKFAGNLAATKVNDAVIAKGRAEEEAGFPASPEEAAKSDRFKTATADAVALKAETDKTASDLFIDNTAEAAELKRALDLSQTAEDDALFDKRLEKKREEDKQIIDDNNADFDARLEANRKKREEEKRSQLGFGLLG